MKLKYHTEIYFCNLMQNLQEEHVTLYQKQRFYWTSMEEWYFERLYVNLPSGYMRYIAVVITLRFNTFDNSLRQKWAKTPTLIHTNYMYFHVQLSCISCCQHLSAGTCACFHVHRGLTLIQPIPCNQHFYLPVQPC